VSGALSLLCVLWVVVGSGTDATPGRETPVSALRSAAPEGERVQVSRPAPEPPGRPTRSRRTTTAPPAVLGIPSIDVSTALVDLGLQSDGTVEVPGDPGLAGWFEPGTAPGDVGSSVILGHVDSRTGPAVFSRLSELGEGDVVWVGREDDTAVRFVVRAVRTFAHDDFPARRIYAAPYRRRVLSLITCGGSYDSTRGGYQANVVVHARRARSA
jgi:sortase (surface protein transpeptidase)